jgi:hypothetical protein
MAAPFTECTKGELQYAIELSSSEAVESGNTTLLTQGIGSMLTDQLPTSHVFRKVHTTLASKFSTLRHLISKVLRMKKHNLMQH